MFTRVIFMGFFMDMHTREVHVLCMHSGTCVMWVPSVRG